MKLVFATSNENKAKEIRAMLPENFELLTLHDVNITEDIPETADTLEGNAKLKADFVSSRTGLNCFADDTGLEVFSLNREPGVLSARYAGPQRNNDDNMNLLLKKLDGSLDRKAQFRTAIVLNLNGSQHIFEGIVKGVIREDKSGQQGFGYDPIFEPENCDRTFGEMSMTEKNQFSHRARAFKQMIAHLESL